MGFSYIALNTLLEQRVERDPEYRRQLRKNGKVLLSQARQLSDTERLERLYRFGLQLEPSSYREQCRQVLSAEELARRHPLPDRSGRADMEADWLWYGLLILWERWFPDLPNFERLDGLMQQG